MRNLITTCQEGGRPDQLPGVHLVFFFLDVAQRAVAQTEWAGSPGHALRGLC